MSKYLELFVQQGSFGFVVASHEKANPHWSNKPIKVIEKAALDAAQLEISRLRSALDQIDELSFNWGYSAISEISRKALNLKSSKPTGGENDSL